ncbi:MAG: transglutaminase-like domain-containing protein [Limnochordia bacterium]|nr:hypothetical protein [Bacillota bacterium]
MKVLTDGELRALVRLLDEEEKNLVLIEEHLLAAGPAALPYLNEAAQSPDPVVRGRARQLVAKLRFRELKDAFRRYAALADWEMDLETGAFLVARYGYPDLDPAVYAAELDRIAANIARNLRDEMYMEDVIDVINEHLFAVEGFRPDNRRFYDPENSYIHRVIERRTGIPITLSVIYLLIAKRLDLPISGVAVPGHFLVRYDSPFETLWIDPFNEGAILSREDCEELLQAMGYPVIEEYLRPCTVRQIIARILTNLAQVFIREGEKAKAEDVQSLVRLLIS